MKDFTKYFDRYPRIISFSYKGKEEFRTFIGGIISIGTFVVLILYAYIMFSILIFKKDTKKNKTTAVKDLVNDSDPIDISESTFAFAFAIKGTDIDIVSDSTYINLMINQFTNVKDTVGSGTKVNIPYQKWGDDFKFYNQTLVKKQGINFININDAKISIIQIISKK